MLTGEKETRRHSSVMPQVEVRLVKLLCAVLIMLPFAAGWFGYYRSRVCGSPSIYRSMGMMAMYLALYFTFGRVYNAYLISHKRISELFFSQLLAISIADVFILCIMFVICGTFPHLLPMLLVFAAQAVLALAWVKRAHKWFFDRYEPLKTAIIYDRSRNMKSLFNSYGLDKRYDVQYTCTVEEFFEGGLQRLDEVDTVFLGGMHSHERNIIIKYCVAHGIDAYILPRIGDVIMSGAQKMHLFHLPILHVNRYNPSVEYVIFKRLFDIVSSLAAIVLFGPVMLAAAIAVKAYDGGPAIYKQVRLTKDGKTFNIYKFRSMRMDAERDGVARLSSGENDERITPVGRFIRKYRLDELPQLFNILRGEMSVVGPRPERPEISAQYEEEIPEFALRLQAKAGLTGYAQVYGKYNTEPYDKLQMDLMYIANPGILEDLKIILVTLYVLFAKDSTQGVEAGQVTAMVDRDGAMQDKKPA